MFKVDIPLNKNFNNNQHAGISNTDVQLMRYVKENWHVSTMLDIGCGLGGHVFWSRKEGIDSYGVDGTDLLPFDLKMQKVDYRTKASSFDIQFDLGWSVEFLEHVEERCSSIYIEDFLKCKILIITAAPPGWGGEGHVNEQSEDYWISFFEKNGFYYDEGKTLEARGNSFLFNNNIVPRLDRKQFVRNRGLVFIRK